jgi:hypothetical protein
VDWSAGARSGVLRRRAAAVGVAFVVVWRAALRSCTLICMVSIVELMLNVLLSTSLDRTLVVWVEAHSHTCLAANASAQISVAPRAYRAAIRQEEVEEFVGNREVRRLLKLLKCSKADQHLKKGQGSFDRW